MESAKGRLLHQQALAAQEKGDFLAALKLIDEALAIYIEEGDILGAAEVLALEVLTFRHLYEKTGKPEFLDLAEISATKSVKMAQKTGKPEAMAIPLHTLGKVLEDLEKWSEAAQTQEQALMIMQNNQPAFGAEIRVHLFADKYQGGDRGAILGLDEAIAQLDQDKTEPRFERDVWLSGGYMTKAKILKSDNPAAASEALAKAKQIIIANPELILRKQQLERLEKEFTA